MVSKQHGHIYLKDKLLLLSHLRGVPGEWTEPSSGKGGQRAARSHEISRDAGLPESNPGILRQVPDLRTQEHGSAPLPLRNPHFSRPSQLVA